MTTVYELSCGYTKGGVATSPASAPTITVVDSANNILVAALTATTAVANIPGLYRYSYSGADGLIIYGLFHTSDLMMDAYDIFVTALINPAVRDIQSRIPAALTADGNIKADALKIDGAAPNNLAARAQMDLVNAPNATALTALAAAVWAYGTRTLSSFGTLVADIWAYATRTLTNVAATVTVIGPVPTGGNLEIVLGDDYYDADGRAATWTSSDWPNLTGATITFRCASITPIAMTAPVAGVGSQTVMLELSKTQSATLKGTGGENTPFSVQAVLTNLHEMDIVQGMVIQERAAV